MKIPIPNDWEGEDWQSYCIQWPNSESWLAIFRGFLSTPLRGRFWDERTGSIKSAQDIGWDIWLRNENAPGCNEDCPDCPDCPEPEPGTTGGAIIESEEDMGQVVTDVQITSDGKLRVFFGPCCYKDLVGIVTGGGGGVIVDDPIIDNPYESGPYYACGKADAVLALVWAVGEGVWAAKDSANPLTWVGTIRTYAPGFDISTSLAVAAIVQAVAIDVTYGDSEVFDEYLWDLVKCVTAQALPSDETGFTNDDFASLQSRLVSTFSEVGRYTAGAWWSMICSVLGSTELNKAALLGSTNSAADCTCPNAEPEGETAPDENGWYLSAPITDDVTYGPAGAISACDIYTAPHDVFGFVYRLEWGGDMDMFKRMSYAAVSCTETIDTSWWGDTSDSLYLQSQYPLFISVVNDAIAQACCDLLNLPQAYVLLGSSYDSSVPATPNANAVAGKILGWRFYLHADTGDIWITITCRALHNINSPSHA